EDSRFEVAERRLTQAEGHPGRIGSCAFSARRLFQSHSPCCSNEINQQSKIYNQHSRASRLEPIAAPHHHVLFPERRGRRAARAERTDHHHFRRRLARHDLQLRRRESARQPSANRRPPFGGV